MQNPRTRRAAAPSGTAAEVVNNSGPSRTCARVVCAHTGRQTGFINKPVSSQTTCARARGARGEIRDPEAYFKVWRERVLGEDFDAVAEAVEDAVAAFSTKTPEADRRIWLKIANRVGAEAFLDAVWQKQSEIREGEMRGRRLRDRASAFQKLLNERFPKEGGAR